MTTTPERDPALARWLAEHLERAPALTPAQADRVSALLGLGPLETAGRDATTAEPAPPTARAG